ncbi:putative LuxR family transcriptional regulator [Paraburkholderia sabiae]|uniref:helix-turn-helix transcriptional regulator n=1 Tax=Paraburkholderia sabiae TaxID=273251 RepID=UPI001CB46590|nr:autoinducer binding domain-containing protein [Paraburkholderia sabiae]CAG9208262.1 putative LuxR family transcriptional regulator [Paraburkholderia sabiae]
MTAQDGEPLVEWFSQADVQAHWDGLPARNEENERNIDNGGITGTHLTVGKSDPFELDFCQIHARMRAAGFSTLSYGAYEMIGQCVLHAYVLRDLAPVSFMQAYFDGMWYASDPRFAEVLQSGFPVAWQLDRLDEEAQRTGDRRALALAASLRAHGMNSGVIFSLSAPQLDLSVGVGLTSELRDADWINDRVVGTALAVSLAVHRFAQPFVAARVQQVRAVVLDPEQEAVLERLVQGLPDQDIADALHLSLHKVGYHIQTLERLFKVQNRAQLAYLAARRVRA